MTAGVAGDLLSRGLLSRREVVDGRVLVREHGGRIGGVAVVHATAPSWFVKRATARAARAALAREARALELLARAPALAGRLPRLEQDDRAHGCLAVELVGGQTLGALASRSPGIPPAALADLGSAVAAIHGADQLAAARELGDAPRPWALALHRPRLDELPLLSGATRELTSIVQGVPEVCDRLDEAAASWMPESLVDGDLRWDNLMLRGPGAASDGGTCIVHWECAGAGDPAWDVGSCLAELLGDGLGAAPAPPGPPGAPDPLRVELRARVRAGATALWTAYANRHRRDRSFLDQCVRFAGARLLERALELAQARAAPTRRAMAHLQLGADVLRDVPAATAALLGTVEEAS